MSHSYSYTLKSRNIFHIVLVNWSINMYILYMYVNNLGSDLIYIPNIKIGSPSTKNYYMIIYFISNTNFSGLCNRWSSFHSDMQSPLHLRDSELNWPIKSYMYIVCMCIWGIMHAYMYITNIFVKMSTKKYCNFWENGKNTWINLFCVILNTV
jgi:hypothetical protein